MQSEALQKKIVELLDDAKAVDIKVIDVRKISSIADYMVIATGTSSRHVSSIADKLERGLREAGVRAWGTEGQDTGEWVLVDFGDVIAHVMQASTRDFYQLEKLWAGGDLSDSVDPSGDDSL